ncbi:hypothetical protein BDV3_004832 [Batrachochytrium dendrobatidis]
MQSVCDKSEQHGFLLDLAPRIAMLLSHPTLIASLQKHEFALLSSVMDPLCSNISGQDPLHNRISHEQLNLLLQILSYLLLRPSMTPDICHLFRPIVIDLVARWLLFPATEYESALGKNIDFSIVSSANTTTAMMASVSISPATLVETSSLKHTRDGVEIKSISSTSKAFDPSVVFVEYLAAAFSCLLPIVPQVKAHAITAFKNSPSLFSAVEYLSKNPSVESTSRLTAIVKSMYRLLDFSRNVFSGIWDHAALYTLLDYPDDTVRIYTAHSLAVLVGMSDAQRSVFLKQHLDKVNPNSLLPLIPLSEQLQIESMHEKLFENSFTSLPLSSPYHSGVQVWIRTDSLSCLTVDMCGILLPHSQLITAGLSSNGHLPLDISALISLQSSISGTSNLVHTNSTVSCLHRMGISISLNLPILLEGPPGAGKTTLVEEASRLVGSSDLLKIHLGDQTDSKLLLGTYMTTSTPGSFKWQPGVLTTAVSEGRWILIEDIDLAPVDVVAVLVPLLETRWLHIPSRGERIQAKDSFRIFATRRAASSTAKNGSSFATKSRQNSANQKHLGESLWTAIFVDEMNDAEVKRVVHSRFPILQGCIDEIMNSYTTLREQFQEMHSVGRQLSTRDLIKWCHRVSNHHQIQSASCQTLSSSVERQREDLFREAFDCFMAMIPKLSFRNQIAHFLGVTLQIPQHRVEFFLENFVPNIDANLSSKKLVCGRVVLPIFNVKIANTPRPPFAPTSPSLRLIERLAVSISLCEPVLLVGETGTGKTTVVQHLASHVGSKLVVINMSQQSDSTDLLGGFKPVDALLLVVAVREEFDDLFSRTFSVKNNASFLSSIQKAYARRNWRQLIIGFESAVKMAKQVFDKQRNSASQKIDNDAVPDASVQKKKPKQLNPVLCEEWDRFSNTVKRLFVQLDQIKNNLFFSFVEGTLVKALRHGHWILLDEINLATAETLECLSGLLQSSDGSVMLLERGDTTPIVRHPNFRLFACMNPANDAGKRDLPPGLRSRFTEFWVESPDTVQADLLLIIRSYIFSHLPAGPTGDRICLDVAEFYSAVKSLAAQGILFDGADQRVHISMRTLTRALSYAIYIAPMYGIRRSLYEATYMTFMTGLGAESRQKVSTFLRKSILNGIRNPDAFVKQVPKHPGEQDDMADLNEDVLRDSPYILIDCFWIEKGPLDIPSDLDSLFVLTPSVKANLVNLSRAVLSRKYPVLIQGPTSAGKTSMVEYLAKRTGHRFLRINNHEHTDIQEYLGSYVSNDQGALAFQDGVLVEALRKGYWIVLDELNLAPSDVLEALNRLLDDNRELFLPETQELIKPHPHFMLFATQNPAGQYGGRKQLSRAFRNRFLELHFSDIAEGNLEMILEKRCRIAPSYAKKLVTVYKSLQKLRDTSRIFDGRQSFITLRDLFRWALRGAVGYQRLAEDGYMQLAERVRKPEDRATIKKILEIEFKVTIDEEAMYESLFKQIWASLETYIPTNQSFSRMVDQIVWTQAMRRLFVLVHLAMQHSEPVLLVGETGCGKTTVVQILSALANRHLHIINAHQNSETADFLGSQRPTREREQAETEFRDQMRLLLSHPALLQDNVIDTKYEKLGTMIEKAEAIAALFETLDLDEDTLKALQSQVQLCLKLGRKSRALFAWADGPLVQAMKQGDFFLLDEISLADDSVLERLNSVLEPQRLLVLAENGTKEIQEITAAEEFRIFATMNPGGDYGKKELSPALRNRFTEIWVSSVSSRVDLLHILEKKLHPLNMPTEVCCLWGNRILDFLYWLADQLHKPIESIVSLRDILAWVGFMCSTSSHLEVANAFFHGGCMVLIDGMSINPLFGTMGSSTVTLAKTSRYFLRRLAEGKSIDQIVFDDCITAHDDAEFGIVVPKLNTAGSHFGANDFYISVGNAPSKNVSFAMQAPTTLSNCMQLLRALQLNKPILLEGSPGVGKTSLVASLAAVSQHNIVRINLSEQTDLMDLFGSDLPVEGGSGGEFAWRDGPFLKAVQDGAWVLLDELNLASQQVLEGLNSCLDHRAIIYIPELDRNVTCHPDFRVFAAQNPQHEGGGRKGLPKSFVNRFSQVYVAPLNMGDLRFISSALYPNLDPAVSEKMITFNERIREETMVKCSFGWRGAPWEFNLRDVLRWIELWQANVLKLKNSTQVSAIDPGYFLEIIYTHRMRTPSDRQRVRDIFIDVFGYLPDHSTNHPRLYITPTLLQIGNSFLKRAAFRGTHKYGVPTDHLQILPSALPFLESLVQCVETKSLPLIIGPTATGKSSIVRLLASISGQNLHEVTLNPGVDALELLGGFEQIDLVRLSQEIIDTFEKVLHTVLTSGLLQPNLVSLKTLTQIQLDWSAFCLKHANLSTLDSVAIFQQLSSSLQKIAASLHTPLHAFADIQNLLTTYTEFLSSGVRGRFEWVDSALIRALEHGDWLLIDNVNLCSTSVLDRLNPLVETNGAIAISERGLVHGEIKVITPHPNFRLFMAMDPQYGEVSRAMRNRSVEIYIDHFQTSISANTFSVAKLTSSVGFSGDALASAIVQVSARDSHTSGYEQPSTDSRSPILNARLIVEQLQRGDSLESAVHSTLDPETAAITLQAMSALGQNYPSCWPQFVSGKLLSQHSTLASLSISAAGIIAHTSCTRRDLKFVSPTSLMPVMFEKPSRADVVAAAIDSFLQDTTFADFSTRKLWLIMWRDALGLSVDRELKDAFDLALRLVESKPMDAAVVKISAFSNMQLACFGIANADAINFPIDLQQTGIPCITTQTSAFNGTVFRLVRRQYREQLVEDSIYKQSADTLVRDMSVVQLSYALQMGVLRLSQLPHPCVETIYPLLNATRDICISILNVAQISNQSLSFFKTLVPIVKLMDRRYELWESTQTSTVDISKLVLCVRRIAKLVPVCVSLCPENTIEMGMISNAVEKAWEALSIEKIKALGVLWKLGGITTLHTPLLIDIATQFYKVNTRLNSALQNPFDWISRKTITAAGLDVKKAVMEGVATLHYLNEKDTPNTELLQMLQDVPEKLDECITKLDATQSVSLMMLSNIDAQLATITLWPFFDTWALASELTIIEKIYIHLHNGQIDNSQLIKSIREFINSAVTTTSLPPLHFEPLQRLVWALDDDLKNNSNHAIAEHSKKQFVHTIAQEALHQWSKSFWNNGFAFWRSSTMGNRESFMMNGQILQLLSLENELATGLETAIHISNKGSESMHIPLYNGLSGHTLALLASISKVPVYSSASKVQQMKALLRHTASPDFEISQRNKFDVCVLMACIRQLLLAHATLYSVETLDAIRSGIDQLGLLTISEIAEIKDLLLQVNSQRMKLIVQKYLSPMIDSLALCIKKDKISVVQLNIEFSKAWVLYSLAFLEVYIPDLPVDPVAMRTAKIALASRHADRLKAGILVSADKEFIQCQNKLSPYTQAKVEDLEFEFSRMTRWRSKLPIRPTRSQMVDIVNELQQVKQSVLHFDTIQLLLTQLVAETGLSSDVLYQEESLQDVIQSIIDRIDAKYPQYRDLLLPACTALYQLKYGIRLMRHAGSILHLRDASSSIAPLVRFVQDFQIEQFDVVLDHVGSIRGNSQSLMQTKLEIQLATIEQLVAFVRSGLNVDTSVLLRIHAFFDAVVDIWGEAEAQQKRLEEEKESLFAMTQANVVTDEEREETEFCQRFPDFFETFADIIPVDPLNDSEAPKDAPAKSKQPVIIPTFNDAQAWRIATSYKYTVGAFGTASTTGFQKQWSSAFLSCLDAAMAVCRLDGVSVPPTMDQMGRLGFVFASAKHISDFSTTNVSDSDVYDFYNDSNVYEAQQIQSLLVKFDNRINDLLAQWPDHDVLVHLSAICRRIASFPVASPLMKLLTGIELLLIKSQDWEAYASKEVSLKMCLDDIVLFIVKWRRLELNTWRQLLKLEERRCAAKVGKLWFHLWRTTMGILRNPDFDLTQTESEKSTLMNGLFATFDNMCISSPIGQFSERLDMLRSFHKHLSHLDKSCPDEMFTGLKTIISILWNVISYYSQFSLSVETALTNARKPILTELKKYVKIATWKDVNVFALKESAKRTHYHLNKFVKKYMLSLEQPVKDVIATFQETPPSMPALPAEIKIEPESMWDICQLSAMQSCQTSLAIPKTTDGNSAFIENATRVPDAHKLLGRMKSMTMSVISDNVYADTASGVEGFLETILERVDLFRKVNVAAQGDIKVAKGQKLMRKKALVDLLKYLAILGLLPRCRQRFAHHQDSFVTNTYPELEVSKLVSVISALAPSSWMHSELHTLAERAHQYHFRNIARIAVVRSAALSMPLDLTMLEIERSVSSLEHLLNISLEQRSLISFFLTNITQMSGFAEQVRYIISTPSQVEFQSNSKYIGNLVAAQRAVNNAVIVVSQSITVSDMVKKHGHSVTAKFIERINTVLESLKAIKSSIDASCMLNVATYLPSLVVVVKDKDSTNYSRIVAALTEAYYSLCSIQSDFPEHDLFIRDAVSLVCSGLDSLPSTLNLEENLESMDNLSNISTILSKADLVVEHLLIAFQHLRTPMEDVSKNTAKKNSADDVDKEVDEFGLDSNRLIDMHNLTRAVFETSAVSNVRLAVSDLLVTIESCVASGDTLLNNQLPVLLAHIAPLFNQYYALAQFRLLQHFSLAKSVSKLTYILSNLFASLFKEGFCLPKSSEEDDDDCAMEDHAEGTGMGEGDGKKDVSDEIENEDQAEGAQTKGAIPPPEPEKHIDDEDDGIEMTNDFDGILEDVDGDDDDNEADDDEDNDQELDEEMGDLDKDLADVVDEKLWDDDDQVDNHEQDEKTECDAPVDGGANESEIVAEEETNEKNRKDQDKKKPQDQQADKDETADDTKKQQDEQNDGSDCENDVETNDPERINEDSLDKFEDSHGIDIKKADDLDKDNDEEDEISDEMDLDGDDDDKDDAEADEGSTCNDAANDQVDQKDADDNNMDQDDLDDTIPEQISDELLNDTENNEEESESSETAEAQDETENSGEEPLKTAGDEPEQDSENSKNQEIPKGDAAENNNQDQLRPNHQPFGIQGQEGNDAIQGDDTDAQNEQQVDGDDGENCTAQDAQGTKSQAKSLKQNNSTESQDKNQQDVNPRRNVGDAMKQWLSRLKQIADSSDQTDDMDALEQDTSAQPDVTGDDNFEFIENDEKSSDAQALGAATEEQLEKMDRQALADDKNQGDYQEDSTMDVDEPLEDPKTADKTMQSESKEIPLPKSNDSKLSTQKKLQTNPQDNDESSNASDEIAADTVEKDEDIEEKDPSGSNILGPGVNALKDNTQADDQSIFDDIETDSVDYIQMRHDLEERMALYRQNGNDDQMQVYELWRSYVNLTRDLAFNLCEQLRLILEPTLATKLKGDYRTGKRLNMRKVITYIASQFKKDKIWLRRTKPSKRTYQVMVAVDDSRSMSESHSVQLAFESLAMISKALAQLEVGDIGIVRFGESVQLVHPFEKPFTDDAGADLIRAFTFEQDRTHVKLMMENAMRILEHARFSNAQSSADLWQLQLVISDGICEDHEYVRALVRKATEERIMVVFIILDNRTEKNSILNMTNVSYEFDPATQQPTLKMDRYMDTFPFDYYVVVRDIERLPEILAETLRQFFMFVSS